MAVILFFSAIPSKSVVRGSPEENFLLAMPFFILSGHAEVHLLRWTTIERYF